MTRSGSFKRVVRDHARRTGQRYTQALADLENISRPFAGTRPFDLDQLKAELESRYRIRITSMLPIDDDPRTRPRGSWPGHYASTLLVQREQGTPWIARVFSSPADQVSRVKEDAEILGFLAEQDFPAERPAVDAGVAVIDGSGVLLTRFIAGGRPTDVHGRVTTPGVFHELGSLLGRLHTLPAGSGAAARDGGAEEHDGGFHLGRPEQDLVAAMRFLVSVEDEVALEGRETFEWLRDRVESADGAEGLPEAFTHSNFHAWAAVGAPGRLSIVGWAGSGRGPRLPALAWLLRTASEGRLGFVDAVMRGYRQHVSLSDEEFDRLAAVANLRPLWLACLDYREAVRAGRTPVMDDRAGYGFYRPERSEQLMTRAKAALSG